MARYDDIRAELEERLARIEQRAGRIQSDLRQPGDRDWEEAATQRENDEVLERLSETEHSEITRIRAALGRLDAGTYGECGRCGGSIQQERLRALPYADTCITCAEAGPGAG